MGQIIDTINIFKSNQTLPTNQIDDEKVTSDQNIIDQYKELALHFLTTDFEKKSVELFNIYKEMRLRTEEKLKENAEHEDSSFNNLSKKEQINQFADCIKSCLIIKQL